MKDWQIIVIGTFVIIGMTLTSGCMESIVRSSRKPNEKFVVTLPGANGGSTQAEIIMIGEYKSTGSENNQGYSWYYNISIKNIGDRGIQLPIREYAEDNSGISVDIYPDYWYTMTLHPNEVEIISNKIFLLQNPKTPHGGGTYHLALGSNNVIQFDIPSSSLPIEITPYKTTLTTQNPTSVHTPVPTPVAPKYIIGDIVGGPDSRIITYYNSYTDAYQYDTVYRTSKGWERIYPDYHNEGRISLEQNYQNLLDHIDPSKIITKYKDKESYQNWIDQMGNK